MKRAVLLFVVFLLLGGLIGGFAYFQFVMKPEMIKGFILAGGQPAVTVTAEPAKGERWEPGIPAIGTFRAIKGVDVAPQVAGVVNRITFDSGQQVEAGDLLVTLDTAVEEADLKSDQALLKNAESDLDRQRALVRRGAASRTVFDAAVSKRDSAAAAVERNKALIRRKTIRAPFSGRLGIRNVDIGQYVSPGTVLVTLQQLDPIFVDFPLPEQNLRILVPGLTVEVKTDSHPGQVFHGVVESIDARVNAETRSITVRAQLDNPKRALLPGMFANITVRTGEAREVVTVPRTSVTYTLYGDSVFVVKESKGKDGKPDLVAERRFVRVGDTREDRVAIEDGVKPGDRVVTSGQIKLQSGARVAIDNSAPLKPLAKRPAE